MTAPSPFLPTGPRLAMRLRLSVSRYGRRWEAAHLGRTSAVRDTTPLALDAEYQSLRASQDGEE